MSKGNDKIRNAVDNSRNAAARSVHGSFDDVNKDDDKHRNAHYNETHSTISTSDILNTATILDKSASSHSVDRIFLQETGKVNKPKITTARAQSSVVMQGFRHG